MALLSVSGVTGNNGFDIPFGGVDDGTLPPGVRELQDQLDLPDFELE